MSKTANDEVLRELSTVGPILKEDDKKDELLKSATMSSTTHLEGTDPNVPQDSVIAAAPQYVRRSFMLSQNQTYIRAAAERCAVIHAEDEAANAQLPQFTPATKGLKGYVKRKKDESELEKIKKESGVEGLDLYTMRINRELKAEREKDADRPAEEFSAKVEKALSWNLSWQMLSPRYLYYNAAKIHEISRTYRELRAGEAANDAFLKTLPAEKATAYDAIMNMTGIFLTAFEQQMTQNGVNMTTGEYELPAEDYEPQNMQDLKERFETERRRLMTAEEPITVEDQGRQKRNTLQPKAEKILSDKSKAWEDFDTSLKKELRKGKGGPPITGSLDRTSAGLLQCLCKFEKLSMKDAAQIYRGIAIKGFTQPDTLPLEKLVEFRKAAEVAIRFLLDIDISQFKFNGDEDLTADGINDKLLLLNFAMEMGTLLTSYNILQNQPVFRTRDYGCTMSSDLVREALSRKTTLEQINGVYVGRLRLLSAESFGEYSNEKVDAMSADDVMVEMTKAKNPAQVNMLNDLYMLKSFQDFGVGTDPNTLLQTNRAKNEVSPNIDEWLETEKLMRSMPEDKLKKLMSKKLDASFDTGTDQEKILKASEMFLVLTHTGAMSFLRTRKDLKNLLEKGNNWFQLEEHQSADFINKEEEVRQGLLDALYAKYQTLCNIPVPAKYLKDGVQADDPEAMQQFAILTLRSDEMTQKINGIFGAVTPLLMTGAEVTTPEGKQISMKEYMNALDFKHQQAVGNDVTRVLNAIVTDHSHFSKLNDQAVKDSKHESDEVISHMSERFMIDLMS